ncbi:MAG: S9 family peptidase [bacterium]|nr:S9 family peptidase [bacterium]
MKRQFFISLFIFILSINFAFSQGSHPITVEDLFSLGRLSDLQLSSDGKWISYTVKFYDMETNKNNSDIWLVSHDGEKIIQLTDNPAADYGAKWHPFDQKIAFVSTRSGTPQIYLTSVAENNPKQLTNISTGANGIVWSPDGKYIAFSSEVYPDLKTDKENQLRNQKKEESLVKGKIIDRLFYRHWNRWTDEKRNHVFVVRSDGGEAWDVTPGDFDSPPLDLGSGHDYCFSPDSREIAFVRNEDPVVAISTNNDIFVTPVHGGEIQKITDNPANDNQPVYSPDGKYLAYRAMKQAGFEADQYDLILYDRDSGTRKILTEDFDRDVGSFQFSPDGKTILFTSQDQARNCIYRIPVKGGKVEKIISDHYVRDFSISPDQKFLYFSRESIDSPTEIYRSRINGTDVVQLTHINESIVDRLEMNPAEDFWFTSFDGQKIHGLLVKPPQFDKDKKYPMIYLIHGGPQGMWSDNFHYRWNAQMFAAPGYVVAMVNFRGSKGYGQEFCNAVSKNWGGGPYQDLMVGVDFLIANYPFIDGEKLAAAGASYGGFMINWICGREHPFKALVSHNGVYDQRSMYGATEELWFPEWEFGGTVYEKPELYEKWSPSNYAKNFSTPTLVIHSENDFRVPVTQGFQMFTALQRNAAPSKLLYFPDEDHFVSKPQNARLWWKTVHEWIAEWIAK